MHECCVKIRDHLRSRFCPEVMHGAIRTSFIIFSSVPWSPPPLSILSVMASLFLVLFSRHILVTNEVYLMFCLSCSPILSMTKWNTSSTVLDLISFAVCSWIVLIAFWECCQFLNSVLLSICLTVGKKYSYTVT